MIEPSVASTTTVLAEVVIAGLSGLADFVRVILACLVESVSEKGPVTSVIEGDLISELVVAFSEILLVFTPTV